MKTTLDLIDVVYNELKAGATKTAINGVVKKNSRPVNSIKEDVIINSLPVTADQLQTAIVNVNVFVPDLTVLIDGEENKIADHVRLKTLAGIATTELEDGINGDYTWDIQQQTVIQDDESASHYINIRLKFFISNI